ncbi:MAG: elongation factor P [Acidobacteria bacterium]|nr:elongation factor P [Acidobacteriota bacterium]
MYETSNLRKGTKVELEGEPYIVVEAQFVKPGKGNAFTRCKLKSLVTGYVVERTWRSGERIDEAHLEERPMQFMYHDDQYHFMDTSTYEQIALNESQVGDLGQWLTENLEVSMLFHNGRPISIDLPNFVEIDIVDCEPAVRGDTKTNAMKQALMATGAKVMVPMFVDNGERIRIDTRTGEYVERVKR